MMTTCSNCGTNNRDGAKFCKGCGQSLPNAVAGSQDIEGAGFSCAACGHVNRAEARFCAKCGAQLVLAAPPLPPSPPPPPPARPATAKLPELRPIGAGVFARSTADAAGPPPSGKRAAVWLALTLVAIAIAVAGATAWWTLGRSGLKLIPAATVATDATASAPAVGNATPKVAAPASVPTAVIAKPAPTSGPHPNWHGIWQGTTPDSKMVISAAGVEIFDAYENDGKKDKFRAMCTWVDTSEANGNDTQSGYAKSSVSLAEISRAYEASLAMFRRDSSDFSISDPTLSRRWIRRINPGKYRVVWAYLGGDCGGRDMIIDGDLILSVVSCHYEHKIDLFTRSR